MRTVAYKIIPDLTNNTISYSKNYRIFTSVEPLAGTVKIVAFGEDLSFGSADPTHVIRKFRYSFNKANWSLWYDFSPSDITALVDLDFGNKSVFFEVKYEYDDTTYTSLSDPISVNFIKFNVQSTTISESLFTPTIYCSSERCPAIIADTASFNPYDVGSAIGIAKEMSYQTNLMFGHDVVYFKTEPDRTSGDFIFKEWTLMQTTDRKCVKVMVPENKFPDNKPNFGEFGVDFEIPFEIHVDHTYFQSMFGRGSQPRKRDYMYFPLTNRMYEIQGSYLFRGFMMEPIYWKIQLTKFHPNADMLMKEKDRKFLDNLIMTSDELFGKQAEEQTKDALSKQQFRTISNAFDETRKAIHPDLVNRIQDFTYNYSKLIEYYYDLNTISTNTETYTLVSNGNTRDQVLNSTSPYTVLAYQDSPIYEAWRNKSLNSGDTVIGATQSVNYTLRLNGPKESYDPNLGKYVQVEAYRNLAIKPNEIRDIAQNGATSVQFKQSEHAIVYKATASTVNTPNLTFCALVNFTKSTNRIKIFDGFDNQTGTGLYVSCAISAVGSGQTLTVYININDKQYSYQVGAISYSTWYAIVIPASAQYGQLGVNVYSFNQDPANIKNSNGLNQVYSGQTNIGEFSFDTDQNWSIPAGAYSIANIRLFNTMIQPEDHEFVISQLFVRDESLLEIIDNARPRLNLPFIAINR